mmetsp:Transcript_8741/g.28144  ORF Transcript_8741/g.28144 Transcript_8741/m.28144 type:complete len:239 (-) Transcript_8741:266-982(-)|eukprot:scaffold6012_cov106-Isochrysis_galbana.AAC.5
MEDVLRPPVGAAQGRGHRRRVPCRLEVATCERHGGWPSHTRGGSPRAPLLGGGKWRLARRRPSRRRPDGCSARCDAQPARGDAEVDERAHRHDAELDGSRRARRRGVHRERHQRRQARPRRHERPGKRHGHGRKRRHWLGGLTTMSRLGGRGGGGDSGQGYLPARLSFASGGARGGRQRRSGFPRARRLVWRGRCLWCRRRGPFREESRLREEGPRRSKHRPKNCVRAKSAAKRTRGA